MHAYRPTVPAARASLWGLRLMPSFGNSNKNISFQGGATMSDKKLKYSNDDGTEFDPDLISKPSLCVTCRKDDDISEEVLCNLNRADQQGGDLFKCYAYESISGKR